MDIKDLLLKGVSFDEFDLARDTPYAGCHHNHNVIISFCIECKPLIANFKECLPGSGAFTGRGNTQGYRDLSGITAAKGSGWLWTMEKWQLLSRRWVAVPEKIAGRMVEVLFDTNILILSSLRPWLVWFSFAA